MTTNTQIDEAALLNAFEQAHALLRNGKSEPDQLTVRALEEQLRPGASLREIRDVMVPLLDVVKLHGLAAAWDTDMESLTAARVIKRAERWLVLGVPEFAVEMLSRAVLPGVDITFLQRRTIAATEADMADRSATYARNLAALKLVQPLAAAMITRMERSVVVMRPMGAGVAQRNGGSAVQVTLQAVSPDEAMSEARANLLSARAEPGVTCIVGATDGTYLSIALAHSASVDTKAKARRIALCDVNAAAVRGLLEVRDVSGAVADGRLRIYAGIDLEAQLMVDFTRPNAGGIATRVGAIVGNCARSQDIVVRVRDRVPPQALAAG